MLASRKRGEDSRGLRATVEPTELDLLLNMNKGFRLAFSVESKTWIMAQRWPHYKSARLGVTGIMHCITPSVSASILHTHKELLKLLEYELWNRLPQIQIILFPSYSPDCLTSLIHSTSMSFVLIRNQICPLPFPHESMQTTALNHLWQVSYNKACTGQAAGCAMATAGSSSSYCHLMFPKPWSSDIILQLTLQSRRHSALVLLSFALQCLWPYWNCQHY